VVCACFIASLIITAITGIVTFLCYALACGSVVVWVILATIYEHDNSSLASKIDQIERLLGDDEETSI
jgi:hypothetical protein